MGEFLYRISPFERSSRLGSYTGASLTEVAATFTSARLLRFLPGRDGLYLLSIDAAKLGDGLKYERVDGIMEQNAPDSQFPHFYGPSGEFHPLPIEALVEVHKLELHEGKHLLPF